MRTLLIGALPPPLGGVSVFVKRYRKRLEDAGHAVTVLDRARLSRVGFALRLLALPFARYDLISLNIPSSATWVWLLVSRLNRRTEFIDHNWRALETMSRASRWLYGRFLKGCKEIVLVAEHLREYYEKHDVDLPPERTRVQHAFLPPPLDEETELLASYPQDALRFMWESEPLLIANAYRFVFYQGVDLYGLDMCLDAIDDLRADYPRIGLLFALAEEDEMQTVHFADIRRQIAERELDAHVHFMIGANEFWALLKRAALFVRPTYTDGFSISLAEALYFNCAAVASDAAPRPLGTYVFRNRDRADFVRQCRVALQHADDRRTTDARQATRD